MIERGDANLCPVELDELEHLIQKALESRAFHWKREKIAALK
jgi:hypothetical protein